MLQANDVMSRALATATPKTPVSQVAMMMRDLNIGDVLIVEEGKLRGIVTDRDLTINVLTNGADTKAPVEKYMTTDVVTGSPDWSLEQVAQVMGEHQVRRLPIVEHDNVVGIVSLGDVAVHTAKRETVGQSLKNISEVTQARFKQASTVSKVIGILLPVGVGVALYVFANSKPGQRVRKQIQEMDLADQARTVINDAVAMLQDPHTRQAALEALEATGLPDKTRQVVEDSLHLLQKSQEQVSEEAMDRANQFAEDARKHAKHAGKYASKYARKHANEYLRNASEYADKYAKNASKYADKYAQDLPDVLKEKFQKRQSKRFIFG